VSLDNKLKDGYVASRQSKQKILNGITHSINQGILGFYFIKIFTQPKS